MNIRKVRNFENLVLRNVLRLHKDSIALFNNKSYASALQLSVLAQEEIGKALILDEIYFRLKVDGEFPEEYQQELVDLTYRHIVKQQTFDKQANELTYAFKKKLKLDSVESERLKQLSTYVGLPKVNGKANFKGRIQHPFTISGLRASRQITKINDFLVDWVLGLGRGYYVAEYEDYILDSKKLLKELLEDWNVFSIEVRKKLKLSGIKVRSG